MKIFRTRSGALYCIETQDTCVSEGYSYHVVTGYKVAVLDSAGSVFVFDKIDSWYVNTDNHLVLIKDHVAVRESTSIIETF